MNILVDTLPVSIEIDGMEHRIHSDFRVCLSIILAFEDEELTEAEKQMILLYNLFDSIPENAKQAVSRGLEFLNGPISDAGEGNGPRVYSFSKDAGLIFAAFRQTHGIDLEAESMHWWKFMTLFMDLGQNTTFCELVSLRKRVKTGKASKEEKAAARELGDMFVIPEIDERTLEEKEAERRFLAAIGGK